MSKKLILLSSLLLGFTVNGINDVCHASIMGYTNPTDMDQTSPYSPYNPINQMDDQMKQIQQNNNLNENNNKSQNEDDNLNDEINSELNNLNIFKVINKFINNIKNLF